MRIAIALASAAIALCPIGQSPSPAPVTVACWDEPNAQMPSGYERIGGDVSGMPKGSVLVALPYPHCAGAL